MKKLCVIVLIFVITITTLTFAGSDSRRIVPNVRYTTPRNDSIVDLAGKEVLEFKWKSTPAPSGGRSVYKFDLYKGFGYEVLASEKLGHKVYSIKAPVDMFEDGGEYTWQVKQRGRKSRLWGIDNRWSFRVKK
ncbi:MAG: hypothetical protein HQ549_01050 [Candidatus Omnitrophica bacterium]|nr:hypothetical protein [Candidatus Omnitrophota bacterium]